MQTVFLIKDGYYEIAFINGFEFKRAAEKGDI
jgi:hypothetical protein